MREIGIYFTYPVTSENVVSWNVNFFIINCISKLGFCKSNDVNTFLLGSFSKEVSFCFLLLGDKALYILKHHFYHSVFSKVFSKVLSCALGSCQMLCSKKEGLIPIVCSLGN